MTNELEGTKMPYVCAEGRQSEEKKPLGDLLKVILILSDGIRGHLNQSRAVAYWLSQLTGAEILEAETPILTGLAKFRARHTSKKLFGGKRRDVLDWLSAHGAEMLLRRTGRWLDVRGIEKGSGALLVLSAGSAPAPYNIALGYIWKCACATIMTPSVIGTEPFDFAIVPEHDYPEQRPNILVTHGAPNIIVKENLKNEAESLLADYPSDAAEKWSILVGGDDANYEITPKWIKKHIGQILSLAQHAGADVYITTSRRTSKAAAKMVKRLAARESCVKYLLIAAEDDFNPIPAMLGFSTEVFCTEDSVNMVSETITGGHRAVLLRVGRKKGIKRAMQLLTAYLVGAGALAPKMLWGVPRFDLVFSYFAYDGVLVEYEDWLLLRKEEAEEPEESEDFNEARRAAQWIYDNWRLP